MASVVSTVLAPSGSWWLLVAPVAPMAPGGFCGFRGSYIPMAHLSSIDQPIREACSPGAYCALDTHPSISISISIYIYMWMFIYIYIYIYI